MGTLDNPVKPERNCILGEVWIGEDSVQTCLCTLPFCNYISLDSSNNTSLGPTSKENNFEIQAREEHNRDSAKIIVSSPKPGRIIFFLHIPWIITNNNLYITHRVTNLTCLHL